MGTKTITTGDCMHVYGGIDDGLDYTCRITIKMDAPVEQDILARALSLVEQRYPHFSVRLRMDRNVYYYEENLLPVVLLNTDHKISLHTKETNFHAWAICYYEDRIHVDWFHGLTDGNGMYRLIATLLYYYEKEQYGIIPEKGIPTVDDPAGPDEWADPQDLLETPEKTQYPQMQLSEAFTLETDGGLTPGEASIWDIEIPEDAFIRFTSANDASPGTMVSVLLARAIDSLYPDRKKEIVNAYVINARPMLEAGMTCHNCLTMAVFAYSDKVRRMPLTEQCTVYRGRTFIQSDADRVKEVMAVNAGAIRAAFDAAPAIEDKKKVFGEAFRAGEGVITFLVSYTGKWQYPSLGEHINEFWAHPPNTFSLMAEIGAVNGKIFLTLQQRFLENTVREAFLTQLDEHGIPYRVVRRMQNDCAHFPGPDPDEE